MAGENFNVLDSEVAKMVSDLILSDRYTELSNQVNSLTDAQLQTLLPLSLNELNDMIILYKTKTLSDIGSTAASIHSDWIPGNEDPLMVYLTVQRSRLQNIKDRIDAGSSAKAIVPLNPLLPVPSSLVQTEFLSEYEALKAAVEMNDHLVRLIVGPNLFEEGVDNFIPPDRRAPTREARYKEHLPVHIQAINTLISKLLETRRIKTLPMVKHILPSFFSEKAKEFRARAVALPEYMRSGAGLKTAVTEWKAWLTLQTNIIAKIDSGIGSEITKTATKTQLFKDGFFKQLMGVIAPLIDSEARLQSELEKNPVDNILQAKAEAFKTLNTYLRILIVRWVEPAIEISRARLAAQGDTANSDPLLNEVELTNLRSHIRDEIQTYLKGAANFRELSSTRNTIGSLFNQLLGKAPTTSLGDLLKAEQAAAKLPMAPPRSGTSPS